MAAQQQHQNQHPNQNTGHGGNSREAGHKRQNHQQRGGNNNQRNNDFYQQSRDRRDSGRHTDGNYNNQHHEVRGGNNYSNQRNNHQRGGGGGGGSGQNHAWTMHRGGPNNGNNMMVRNRGGGRGRMQNQVSMKLVKYRRNKCNYLRESVQMKQLFKLIFIFALRAFDQWAVLPAIKINPGIRRMLSNFYKISTLNRPMLNSRSYVLNCPN